MPDPARHLPVGLSTASVYPEGAAAAFETAARLGYDGVEIMVWTDPISQNAGALRALADHHGIDIVSIHAPTLLLTQRVMSPDPWGKVDRSIELAQEVGAPTVVLHPPFRWQKEYARTFADGVAEREDESGIVLAVENMFPWAARGRQVQAYLPHWDPVPQPYDHVTIDLSHTATARSDAMQMVLDLGDRLSHIHLADGHLTTLKDDHLVPGRGTQPCAEVLQHISTSGFSGAVVLEVGTRRRPREREDDLRESLEFARRHLGQVADDPGEST
ncbi:sugar phosphate isomerase/epimerase family protein [Janibacter limosus]|jgi:sugar phosphate isomerase/epimerase|uniref:Sugar phosphate isomerase/epimerase n=1 Tax=Janibacter limosus TaxID=53458 RepID=A0A4P6MNR3_9MICO|nr:sugar phosphate isomerase/epimerase [Janibacter limosus]QBF45111.1 sugar phosphate isomerase/epimerase [Janibacter limosus]